MKLKNFTELYFSPTGTTRKILEAITTGLGEPVKSFTIDITRPEERKLKPSFLNSDLVLIGAPVYSGRLPVDAASYFKRIKADKIPVVLVVVYGNREYEDALVELRDIAVNGGFIPVACGAFIGEHSFSSDDCLIAQNRPDETDLGTAGLFGKKIAQKLLGISGIEGIKDIDIPGNVPYKKSTVIHGLDAIEVTHDCDHCGICVSVCPEEAIEANGYLTDKEKCIYCCACIKACPVGARRLKPGALKEAARKLSRTCKDRKEPEIFL
jgi:ferredoxin